MYVCIYPNSRYKVWPENLGQFVMVFSRGTKPENSLFCKKQNTIVLIADYFNSLHTIIYYLF